MKNVIQKNVKEQKIETQSRKDTIYNISRERIQNKKDSNKMTHSIRISTK